MDGVSGASAIAPLAILGGKLVIQVHNFVNKFKDAPLHLRSLYTDLKSTVTIFGKMENALNTPGNMGVFSLQHTREEFDFVIEMVMELFKKLSKLVVKYHRLESSYWQKAKWSSVGLDEALQLGKALALHKANLSLTLQLSQSHTLYSIDRGVGDAGKNVRILMDQVESLRQRANGVKKARLTAWLDSVESYAGSTLAPEDVETRQRD